MTGDWRKVVGGKIVADPTTSLPVGSVVNFDTALFPPFIPSGSGDLREWEHFGGALLNVVLSKGETHHSVDGSAVLVAPGIALAAWHVLEPWLAELASGAMIATCFAISKTGLNIWHVRQFTYTPDSDLLILSLALGSELPVECILQKCALTTRLPRVGERIMVAGFKAMRPHFGGAERAVGFEGQVRVGVGNVTAVYPTGRDRCVLPWPVFEVACETVGGMSGGPAFDENGMLIGLLCSSFESDDGLGPSYVSLLWPALGRKVAPGWPNGLYSCPQSLLEMDRRLCFIERPEAIKVEIDQQTGCTQTQVAIWEGLA